jgi:hypothetical protein
VQGSTHCEPKPESRNNLRPNRLSSRPLDVIEKWL